MLLVTGGAGFIGSNFVINWIKEQKEPIINLDKLTYAGNPENLHSIQHSKEHTFIKGDVADKNLINSLLKKYQPRGIIHFAAETHVDRSILSPSEFIQSNIIGTFHLLEEAHDYWKNLPDQKKENFRFIHISTDEVYGTLAKDCTPFTESTPYSPNSPYSASKASSDHLVRAYHETYNFPVITTHCTNNYGPFQFPEKLIPVIIFNSQKGTKIPIYGDGLNERNWIFVQDHNSAVKKILEKGTIGEVYNIGDQKSRSNKELVMTICQILDDLLPNSPSTPHHQLIEYVEDRPGHDWRYDIDSSKLQKELGWKPKETFENGLYKTVKWYLDNPSWIQNIMNGSYQKKKNKQLNY